jgi:hypothetical protein
MNNMMYLRDACFELMVTDMPSSLRDLVSSWLDVQPTDSTSPINNIRVLHPLKSADALLESMFRGKTVCYSTAFIGKVRFTTSDLARNKVIDDSSIIFKTGNEENFGRIRRIFKVNDGDPVFYVDAISIMADFRFTASGIIYQYSNIQTGSHTRGTNSVFISGEHIVEKCVFYERDNKVCTFFRFPNLQESS